MLDNSFDIKSFTVNIILNSWEKILRFLTLINTDMIDITFIDKFLMLKLCEHFDIQLVSLSKLKSI